MDLAQLTELIKSLSPFVAVLVLIGALVYRWFEYREKRAAAQDEKEAASQEKEARDNLLEVLRLSRQNADGLDHMKGLFSTHNESANQRFQQELEIFKQILRQLISLNATATDGISPDNAKLIVQYQWNWCRSETSRIIQNSIRNNHFRGDEERVARSVYRAWHRAASDAMESVRRLKGVTYPYQAFYTHHIAMVWDIVWRWAIPVYYSSRRNSEDFDEALRDLDGLIVTLFDQVFDIHVDLVEDVDVGLLYDEGARDGRPLAVPNDMARPTQMAQQLALHSASPTDTPRSVTAGVLRDRIAKHLTERHQRPQKTKSSAEIQPVP